MKKKNPKVNIEYMEPTDKSPEEMFKILKEKFESEHGPIKSSNIKKFVGGEEELKEFLKTFDEDTQEKIMKKIQKDIKKKKLFNIIRLPNLPDIVNEYIDKTNMVFFALNYITKEIKKEFNHEQCILLDEISDFEKEYMRDNKQSLNRIIEVYTYIKDWESRAIKAQIFSLDNIKIREEPDEEDCENCENTGCNKNPRNPKNRYKISENTDNSLLN
jgi:translation elongation factor EF-G